jgi:polysaccharide biosynthesis protein PelC
MFINVTQCTKERTGSHADRTCPEGLRMWKSSGIFLLLMLLLLGSLAGCAGRHTDVYHDQNMDFGAIQTVAVMPLANLTRESLAAERLRDVFINKLLSTGAVYVLPVGEVARGITRAEVQNPVAPSPEELVKLGGIVKAQAIFTGAVREYGEVRAGTTAANVLSVSLQMVETQTGRVVWSASSTQGGITIGDRLFGGGGQPMDVVTEKAINDLIKKLFK